MGKDKTKCSWSVVIRNWSVVIPILIGIVGIGVIISLSMGVWGPAKIPSYQEKFQGHPVYYLSSAHLYENDLSVITVEDEGITVVNMGKNLTIKVDSNYPGTVLVVKHWEDKILRHADSAVLIVRKEEHKVKWEEAIAKALKEYEESLKPRDILPENS